MKFIKVVVMDYPVSSFNKTIHKEEIILNTDSIRKITRKEKNSKIYLSTGEILEVEIDFNSLYTCLE